MSLVNVKSANKARAFAYIRLAIGGIFSFAFGSMVYTTANNANKVLAGILFVPFFLIFIGGLKVVLRLRQLYKIDAVLSGSQKHVIELSVLSEVTGIKEKKLLKKLKLFIKKKYLRDCSLNVENSPQLIIQGEEQAEDISIVCPECQHEFTAKNGAVARCPECASIINIAK